MSWHVTVTLLIIVCEINVHVLLINDGVGDRDRKNSLLITLLMLLPTEMHSS